MLKSNSSDAAQIMREFTFAVDIGLVDQAASCSSNRWSQVVTSKSLIRQAMLLLNSNKNIPDKTLQENTTKASSFLSKLNVSSLSDRIKCLYYLAESELCEQRDKVDGAIEAATQAQTIATKCGFASFLHSTNAKLHSLISILKVELCKSSGACTT